MIIAIIRHNAIDIVVSFSCFERAAPAAFILLVQTVSRRSLRNGKRSELEVRQKSKSSHFSTDKTMKCMQCSIGGMLTVQNVCIVVASEEPQQEF